MKNIKKIGLILSTLVFSFALVGCSGSSDSSSSTEASATEDTNTETTSELTTYTEGKLTIATGNPAYEPWVINDDPESGEGFEAALGYLIAEELGFAREDVIWVRADFSPSIAPGIKDWDFNIQQFTPTDERREVVDFASEYYSSPNALVVLAGGKWANITTLQELIDGGFKVAVANGSTAVDYAKSLFPEENILVYDDLSADAEAVISGQADGIITGLIEAQWVLAESEEGGKVIGIVPNSDAGLAPLLQKDSPLTQPVSDAIDTLKANGKLQQIVDQYLSAYSTDGIPTLSK